MPPKDKHPSDPSLPTPSSLTLLFKSHRTTLLLYAQKDTPFSTLKSSLLSALRSRSPTSVSIPDSATEADIHLARRGEDGSWIALEDGSGVGEMCPAACGVRNEDVIAFKLGEEGEWVVEEARFEDDEE